MLVKERALTVSFRYTGVCECIVKLLHVRADTTSSKRNIFSTDNNFMVNISDLC